MQIDKFIPRINQGVAVLLKLLTMGELTSYFRLTKRAVKIKNDNSTKPVFSPIFDFPFTEDYYRRIEVFEKQNPRKGRRPNYFYNGLYGEIIEREIKPAGILIPSEWYQALITYKTSSVYLIADIDENILYIGKCNYPPLIRIFDRMVPETLNQMNNASKIWYDYISKGKKVKCAFCYDLSFNSGILEYVLLEGYKTRNSKYPIFNKQPPGSEHKTEAREIMSKLKLLK